MDNTTSNSGLLRICPNGHSNAEMAFICTVAGCDLETQLTPAIPLPKPPSSEAKDATQVAELAQTLEKGRSEEIPKIVLDRTEIEKIETVNFTVLETEAIAA